MGQFDLSLPTYPVGDGACGGFDFDVQIGFCPKPVQPLSGSGAHGFNQLHLALGHLYLVFLWLRLELLCRVGILSNLFRCAGHLDFPVDYQPDMVEIFPVWPAGVAVAEFDVLENTADAAVVSPSVFPLFFNNKTNF